MDQMWRKGGERGGEGGEREKKCETENSRKLQIWSVLKRSQKVHALFTNRLTHSKLSGISSFPVPFPF